MRCCWRAMRCCGYPGVRVGAAVCCGIDAANHDLTLDHALTSVLEKPDVCCIDGCGGCEYDAGR